MGEGNSMQKFRFPAHSAGGSLNTLYFLNFNPIVPDVH